MFGILNLFKPSGITSRDAVTAVSRVLGERQIGHAGTLDPLAEGVLLLAVGKATRLVPFMQDLPKRYVAKFQIGITSTTQDIQGTCQDVPWQPFDRADLERVAGEFVGNIWQTPPVFSAVRINGRRAYKFGLKGRSVEIAPRQIQVDSIRILDCTPPYWTMEVVCGKGTYVRTLGHDIGIRLGSAATLTALLRASIGRFVDTDTQTIEMLKQTSSSEVLLNPVCLFEDWTRIDLTPLQLDDLTYARPPTLAGESDKAIAVDSNGRLCAVLQRNGGGPFRFLVNFQGRG
ncbi:MAG: tRNA pseudouridine(55) synthase TruB [Pirellulaceae bacterium]